MAERPSLWLMALVAALLGVLVGMMLGGCDAVAQGEGASSHVLVLAGAVRANDQPVYVIDAQEQALLIYEYGRGKGGLDFAAARTLKYDKLLMDFQLRGGRGPGVRDTKKMGRLKDQKL